MQKTAKIISLLLVMTLCVTSLVFAGGGQASGGSSASAGVVRGPYPGGWKPTHDYSKQVSFSMATVQTIEGYNYTSGDPFAKWWSDNFNYKIDVTSLTFDNWAESLRIWINSGDMPDIAVMNYNHADMSTYVEQGLIKKFPANWKQKWPNLARVHDRTSLGPQMEKTFGGVYMIPRSRFDNNIPHDPLPDHIGFFYRKDWAQAVGFPVKTLYTTTEVMEYAKLIKDKDPGKLGARLKPIASRAEWAWRFFVQSNFAHYRSFYKETNGQYVWGPFSEKVLPGMKLFYKAYNEGLLDRDFYTLKDLEDYDQYRVALVSGGFFGEGTVGHMMTAETYMKQADPNIDPEKAIGFATVLGEDKLFHQEDLINFWGCIIFKPDVSDDIFNRYMDMMDFQCSDGGYTYSQIGFENVDWKRENGQFVSLLPPGQNLAGSTGKYPSMGYVIAVAKLADDFSFDNPANPKVWRDYSRLTYKERSDNSTNASFTPTDWALFTYDSPSMRKVPSDLSPEFANIITSAKSEADVETLWRAWVQKNRPLIDPVLQELNSKLK
ncbi:hypothetical protein FACS189479_07630 [Spirochaetia bacterium]|nr:hypothetical protein FACS189479_07630 [Spirochaetia bacterium]